MTTIMLLVFSSDRSSLCVLEFVDSAWVSRSREVVGRRSSAAGCCCVDHDLEIPAAEATIHNPQLTTDHHTTTRLLTAVLSSRNCSTEVTVLPTPHARTRLIVYGTGTLRGDTLLTRWYREL